MNPGSSELIKEFQKRLDKKVRENEISVVQYWKERLDKLVAMKPEGIAPLKIEMQKLSDMMETRIVTLKKG
jgi:hypothetical protein